MFYQADKNFFKSTQSNRKGKPIRHPKFKRRMSLPTARFIKGGFNFCQLMALEAKIRKLKILWSRELLPISSSVTPN